MNRILNWFHEATHNPLLQLVALAIVFDTVFGVLRAIKERRFNSCVGIDGALRKVGMVLSLVFLRLADHVISVNLIGFIPESAREVIGLKTIGMAEFFALLYIAYEVISVLKNMALCGLPVKGIWDSLKRILGKYTDELPEKSCSEK